jgi:hypothetical protein
MRQDDILKERAKSDEQLEREISNWDWFKSLKPGDKATVFTDNYGLPKDTDCRDKIATVIKGFNNGKVEVNCEGEHLIFWYCRYPNDMNVTIGLIPPRE